LEVLEEGAWWALQVAFTFVEDHVSLDIIALSADVWLALPTLFTGVIAVKS